MPAYRRATLAVLGLTLPLLLGSGDPASNRDRLTALRRDDPEQYARLYHRAVEFLSLPAERQGQLRTLDGELHRLPAQARDRLLTVAARYTAWLNALPAERRQQIEAVADGAARLDLIRRFREEEWVATLPQAVRDELKGLQGDARGSRLEDLRRERRLWQFRWDLAARHWPELMKKQPMPARLSDFPEPAQTFVKEYLWPALSDAELAMLGHAEGRWPLYPCTLVALADRHPQALPGPQGACHIKDLPQEVQQLVTGKFLRGKPFLKLPQLRQEEGKWPAFAVTLTRLMHEQAILLPNELWPTRSVELSLPVRTFLADRLIPLLTPAEADALKVAEGVWPDYPQTIERLARGHALEVPWQTLPPVRLPGDRGTLWDRYRVPPEVFEDLWAKKE